MCIYIYIHIYIYIFIVAAQDLFLAACRETSAASSLLVARRPKLGSP